MIIVIVVVAVLAIIVGYFGLRARSDGEYEDDDAWKRRMTQSLRPSERIEVDADKRVEAGYDHE